MTRYIRINVGYYEQLCETKKMLEAKGKRPLLALYAHACQRLKEIRELIEQHPDAYDEETKILEIRGNE